MFKFMLGGASALVLVATAAAADPAATKAREEAVAKDATAYLAPETKREVTPKEVATKDDAMALAAAEFLRADVNVDGVLDKAEFAMLLPAMDAAATAKPDKAAAVDASYAKIAGDDAMITQAELVADRTEVFEKADANKDQMLDKVESRKFATLVAVNAPRDNKIR